MLRLTNSFQNTGAGLSFARRAFGNADASKVQPTRSMNTNTSGVSSAMKNFLAFGLGSSN